MALNMNILCWNRAHIEKSFNINGKTKERALTIRQFHVLMFIKNANIHTLSEIAKWFSISKSSMSIMLSKLEKLGYLTRKQEADMDGRKVSGTLTEASFSVESGGLAYAVVGVGVNVKSGCFPPSLSEIAGSVYGEGEYPVEGRARLAAAILERFRYYYDRIPERAFFSEYRRRSLVIGKRVSVFSGALEGEAEVLDLNENCFLKVRFPDGRECLLSSGEVSIKLK